MKNSFSAIKANDPCRYIQCVSTEILRLRSTLHTGTSHAKPVQPQRVPGGFGAPKFWGSRYKKVVKLSALQTGCLYPPGYIAGSNFCQRFSRSLGDSVVGRIMSMKNSNDTIENRTRYLPPCSAVPPVYIYAVCTLSLECCVSWEHVQGTPIWKNGYKIFTLAPSR